MDKIIYALMFALGVLWRAAFCVVLCVAFFVWLPLFIPAKILQFAGRTIEVRICQRIERCIECFVGAIWHRMQRKKKAASPL